jgi:glycosyltransferase involved in cell wall biosynthesis
MNIFLDNVDPEASTGPNYFAVKLAKFLKKKGHQSYAHLMDPAYLINNRYAENLEIPWLPDAQLSFIKSYFKLSDYYPSNLPYIPLIHRLDGIYFDKTKDYMSENSKTLETYRAADSVIFQSNYSKNLVFKNFGECENYIIINNGADYDLINNAEPYYTNNIDQYENIWCCASNWRGSKRLLDNIRYFLEFSGKKDCLLVAGAASRRLMSLYESEPEVHHDRIMYLGQVGSSTLHSIYKTSNYFIHLSRYDACPNVVVDARAAGCHIVCSSDSGTKEVAGKDATVVVEEPWDYSPVDVDNPPRMSFDNIIKNDIISDICINNVVDRYIEHIKYVKVNARGS